jgi:hypothetical protein
MDCRHPGHKDVILANHPWPPGSGNPGLNDASILNGIAPSGGRTGVIKKAKSLC